VELTKTTEVKLLLLISFQIWGKKPDNELLPLELDGMGGEEKDCPSRT